MGAITGSDWIYNTLTGNSELMDLINGVFTDGGSIGDEHPIIRIDYVDGEVLKNNGSIIWFDEVYDVIAVDQSKSYVSAATIAEKVLALLDNATEQSVGDGVMIGSTVIEKIKYPEKVDGKEYAHLGYSFRVYSR
jgi:hypothetical protein